MKITKRQLRRIIREAMEPQAKFPDVSHPSLSPYVDHVRYKMQGKPGQAFAEYVSYEYDAGGLSRQGITIYLRKNGKYIASVHGSYNNTLSGKMREFDDPIDAVEDALESSPSGSGPTARELLMKVGQKTRGTNYFGQD